MIIYRSLKPLLVFFSFSFLYASYISPTEEGQSRAISIHIANPGVYDITVSREGTEGTKTKINAYQEPLLRELGPDLYSAHKAVHTVRLTREVRDDSSKTPAVRRDDSFIETAKAPGYGTFKGSINALDSKEDKQCCLFLRCICKPFMWIFCCH